MVSLPHLGTLAEAFFFKAAFKAFLAAAQGLENGFGRGREAALENGEREAHCGAAFVVQLVRAVEFVLHIFGHGLVEFGFLRRKAVVHRGGVAVGEEFRAVELQEFFLH